MLLYSRIWNYLLVHCTSVNIRLQQDMELSVGSLHQCQYSFTAGYGTICWFTAPVSIFVYSRIWNYLFVHCTSVNIPLQQDTVPAVGSLRQCQYSFTAGYGTICWFTAPVLIFVYSRIWNYLLVHCTSVNIPLQQDTEPSVGSLHLCNNSFTAGCGTQQA
jgi:uncharacterized protein YaiE (UPF0345 family)